MEVKTNDKHSMKIKTLQQTSHCFQVQLLNLKVNKGMDQHYRIKQDPTSIKVINKMFMLLRHLKYGQTLRIKRPLYLQTTSIIFQGLKHSNAIDMEPILRLLSITTST
jgi:hypothetical protein